MDRCAAIRKGVAATVAAPVRATLHTEATPAAAKQYKAWKKLLVVPGMGGATDFVTGAQRFIVAMTQTAKGRSSGVDICAVQRRTEKPTGRSA